MAISETLNKPKRANTSSVFPPTPQSAPTGKGCKNAITSSGETTSSPSGLALVEANLAINFVGATPTEQVMFSCANTFSRNLFPISVGVPNNFLEPDTSRNASSTLSGSTKGVIE